MKCAVNAIIILLVCCSFCSVVLRLHATAAVDTADTTDDAAAFTAVKSFQVSLRSHNYSAPFAWREVLVQPCIEQHAVPLRRGSSSTKKGSVTDMDILTESADNDVASALGSRREPQRCRVVPHRNAAGSIAQPAETTFISLVNLLPLVPARVPAPARHSTYSTSTAPTNDNSGQPSPEHQTAVPTATTSTTNGFIAPIVPSEHSFAASELAGARPVLVSLTSVSFRLPLLSDTLRTLLHGLVLPTHIYLFLSSEANLLDEGVHPAELPPELLSLVARGLVTVVFTDNIGPHRKLLPLLRRFYKKDVLIVTVDDDMSYRPGSTLLYQILRTFRDSDGSSAVALRARRIGVCGLPPWQSWGAAPYHAWSLLYTPGRSEMLVLPTGTGGVLYRPRFFHPIVFDPILRAVTSTADDVTFRVAALVRATSVIIACRDLEHNGLIARKCPVEERFNSSSSTAASSVAPTAFDRMGAGARVGAGARYDSSRTYAGFPGRSDERGNGGETGGVSTGKYKDNRKHTEDEAHFNTHPSSLDGRSLRQTQQQRQLRQSLYRMNKHGRNDEQWRVAVALAEQRGLLDFSRLVKAHLSERGRQCFSLSPQPLGGTDDSSNTNTTTAADTYDSRSSSSLGSKRTGDNAEDPQQDGRIRAYSGGGGDSSQRRRLQRDQRRGTLTNEETHSPPAQCSIYKCPKRTARH